MLSICQSSNLSAGRLFFRNVTKSDIPAIALLYAESVLKSGCGEYSAEQLRAWASRAMDKNKWKQRIQNQYFVLVEYNGALAGFASLQTPEYIDVLYVHPKYQRMGLAGKLYHLLEIHARRSSADVLWANVSKIARPFFEKQGFIIQQEKENLIDELILINYTMYKQL